MTQPTLFDPPRITPSAAGTSPAGPPIPAAPAERPAKGDTRRAAHQASAARAPSARERVYAVIVAAGEPGATLDSLEVETQLPRSTVSARLTELEAAERIIDTGRRVISRYGSPLTVFAVGSGCNCLP